MWRSNLLNRTWESLKLADEESEISLYSVLRLRADDPDLDSAHMAQRISEKSGKVVDVSWTRKRLHFARKKFGELLLEEISQTLESPTRDAVADELQELGLLEYVKEAR
jgi:hypothetical protein